MKSLISCFVIILMVTLPRAHSDDGPFQFEFQELSPGVWAGVRPDSPRYPVMGNTMFVISTEGVVVFDGGGMSVMAEQIIEKVRSLTDKSVTHVVISHWHGDHNFGVYRFAEEFENVKFIAHEFTDGVFHSSRIHYIDRQRDFIENNIEEFRSIVETGKDARGIEQGQVDRNEIAQIVAGAEIIDYEFNRARVTPATVVFTDHYSIQSGNRRIELLHLGHANTAGDIVMWLPDEGIVATGDIVVLPSPYAFNVPPRAWAQTLRALNDLNYSILVPGHGAIQTDSSYVDLIVEVADAIAEQRDTLLADGASAEEVAAALDFSSYEERFTHGDDYIKNYYDAYFEEPFRAAAMKALTGEPMVAIAPPKSVPFDNGRWKIEASEYEIVDYLGQPALKIRGGTALLPDVEFRNALVEFDMAISPRRGIR